MPTRRQLALLACLIAIICLPASAYYHYVHYLTNTSPYSLVREHFDLSTLPDKTVTFFVSTAGPTNYTANDSFPSVISQIRDATQVWNSVATSDLRFAFGGLQVDGTAQNAPGGEVVFEELPPGLLAFSGPSSRADITQGPDGPFVPILRSIIHLNIDMTVRPGPSYLESFLTTVVHEMGHAIGLQHAFTSATMSTAVTRATSRARPLDADDIAAISLLYPTAGFPTGLGSITGQVTAAGQGVHMASVVAILPNGSAISNLTNPDGTYEIDGVPPGNYWVYVHPLPPTANVWYPRDYQGNALPPDPPFFTTFYPGTTNPAQFGTVTVTAGATAGGINFSVQPRVQVELYDISPYSYPSPTVGQTGQIPVQPAYLNANAGTTYQTIVADGYGITTDSGAAPGLTVQVLGGPGPAQYQAYGQPNTALAVYLQYPSTPPAGPEHLLFATADDIYVLPQAIQMVESQPPLASNLISNPDGSVTITGINLGPDSKAYFDGLLAAVTVPFAVNSQTGAQTISVTPPPGASGQNSTITIFDADGQNSMFLQSQAPLIYSYPQAPAPAANISIAALPTGASSMVDVTTSTMQFVDGMTTLGFGTGDVVVRRLWVLSPNHLIANVTVSPNALQGSSVATVVSGFQIYEQDMGFQVMPTLANLPLIGLPVANSLALQNSLYPGAVAAIYGQNLVAPSATPSLTLGGQPVSIAYASPGQINFVVPAGQSVGPAILTLNNGLTSAFPVVLQVDEAPPVITGVDSQSPAPGDTITLTLTGLDPNVLTNPSRLTATEGVVNLSAITIEQPAAGATTIQVQVTLSPYITGQQIPLTVSVDGDVSLPYYINVAVPSTLH